MSTAHRAQPGGHEAVVAQRQVDRPQRRGAPRWFRLLAGAAVVAAVTVAAYLLYRSYGTLVPGVEDRAFDNADRLLGFERRSELAWERAAQRSSLGTGVIGAALTAFYALAYWPFVVGAAVAVAVRDRPASRLLRNAVLISGAIGLLVILVAPVVPPRLLEGFEDQVAQRGLGSVAHPSSLFNPYAAVPSFHVAWTTLAAVALARTSRAWLTRAALASVPVVMAVAVVTTGNHYVLDVVAGLAVAAVAHGLAPHMERGLDGHRARAAARRGRLQAAQSRPRLHIASRSWRL